MCSSQLKSGWYIFCRQTFTVMYTAETNSTVEHTLYFSHPESCHTVHREPALPSLRDLDDVGVLCTFNNIRAAAAAGIARSSQLRSQAVQYVKADGTAGHHIKNPAWPLDPSPPAR